MVSKAQGYVTKPNIYFSTDKIPKDLNDFDCEKLTLMVNLCPMFCVNSNIDGSLGLCVVDRVCGGVLRVSPAKHPHIFTLPRETLKTHIEQKHP